MENIGFTPEEARPLLEGKAPEAGPLLERLTVGIPFLTDFLVARYLDDYIPEGGSKIKFVTGRFGAGKTHVGRLMLNEAKKRPYLTAAFSARDIGLYDFKNVYLEILRQCGMDRIIQGCADHIVREMGHDPAKIGEGKTYVDFLADEGAADALSKSAIREYLRNMFMKNPRLDNNFATCMALLVGDRLGHPVMDGKNKELLLGWLAGDKSVKLAQLRPLGLFPTQLNKYNARQMLRSLAEAAHLGGFDGIFVFIDDLEALAKSDAAATVKYTAARRGDAYEGIRQLIDDIDSMRYLMFLFSFDRELLDNQNSGIPSYQALWMRIQTEVSGKRFNRFADLLDLDLLADTIYPAEALVEMSGKLADVLEEQGYAGAQPGAEEASGAEAAVKRLTAEEAAALLEKSQFGGLGLPYLVNRATQGTGKEE
ncbi:MAG: DUF2791 family P-loop domain-containing protein [Lachnospiraceae bacterium]|nr:DUF2791 family P-loop domain-containing protein [Lachnospiraceae bacterium]